MIMRMAMELGARTASASSARRGSPAPSCCACAPVTPASRWCWPPATPRPARTAAELYPSLAAAYPDLVFSEYDPAACEGLDLVFLALPHGASQELVPDLRKRVGAVVDLAADFRLQDAALYPRWYGEEHRHPELLAEFAFGLPELFREEIVGATLVAAPGCYVTAASLALAPLVRLGLIERTGVVVDAASGVSGAGRGLKPTTAFCTVDEDFTAYGLLDHRHTPEIEQATGAAGALHPPPRADEPGDPRHLLRPADQRPPRRRRCSTRFVRFYERRAVRGRERGLAVHQGHPRLEHRPPHRSLRRAHGLGHGDLGASTTSSRAPRARPSSAPTSCSACPRRPGFPLVGVYP